MVSEGDRIELISTEDPHTNLSPGDRGTVTGTKTLPPGVAEEAEEKILVDWDNGSLLGDCYMALIAGVDQFKQVDEDKQEDEPPEEQKSYA